MLHSVFLGLVYTVVSKTSRGHIHRQQKIKLQFLCGITTSSLLQAKADESNAMTFLYIIFHRFIFCDFCLPSTISIALIIETFKN